MPAAASPGPSPAHHFSGMSELLQALRIVRRKDSDEFRQFVFAELSSRKPGIRAVLAVYGASPFFLKAAMVWLWGFASTLKLRGIESATTALAVYAYRNEERQIEFIADSFKGLELQKIKVEAFRIGHLLNLAGSLKLVNLKQFRLAARFAKRNDFLVSCRLAETLMFYAKAVVELRDSGVKLVVVSSDTNPYAMGYAFAARRSGIKSLYINHGHIPEGPPRLVCDISLLDGNALADLYKRAGPPAGRIFFKGVEGEFRALNLDALDEREPVIGVFLSLVTDAEKLLRVIEDITRRFDPKKIVLRPHPNEVIRNHRLIGALRENPRIEVSPASAVAIEDLKKCHFIFAASCSVHLTALRFGVPTIHVDGLDAVPHDFYPFVSRGIVPYFRSVDDVDLDAVKKFYQGDWSERFRYFDESYGQDAASFRQRLVEEVGRCL
ncbi:MAG: hypothetical protein SF051_16235 [Elusimicrobiota bacterium]|nr:hypothetical protein [Elusimicrobiota bacterium]